jgi:nucleotide-binding universal stress UspA family protein
MYRILVPVDGSKHAERAAAFAVDLARRIGDAELLLINVQEPVEESQTHGLARDAIQRHRETLAVDAAAAATAIAGSAAVGCGFEWRFGDPADVIADVASTRGCDLIAMGTHGTGAIRALLIGSVAQRTLNATSVPVVLIR